MTTRTVETLASGGHYFEGARWRDGLWWVSDIYAGKVCTYDSSGTRTVIMEVEGNPSGLGWLPDGSLLVVSMHDRKLLKRAANGAVSVHADLSGVCDYEINDMVVDKDGRAYIGTIGFAIAQGEDPRAGSVYRVDPDGTVSVVADGMWCPNGMVITNDDSTLVVAESFAGRMTAFTFGDNGELTERRVLAQFGTPPPVGPTAEMMAGVDLLPDGCAIDVEDHIWIADGAKKRIVRLSPQGEIVEELTDPAGNGIYACALGGPDNRTLLLCTVPDFFAAAQGIDTDKAVLKTTTVDVPHGGRP
ncbi:gluconolactonase [Tamaricihabitans halophyticus]|uniref:Gluconolactonase n=1 Tax=Tamaricihabitans halophyticus TaxID=1262583 RepID=A0A4R2QKR9_9PSEU|nr:SMP-30/gluconolactonase/LRE family protein [Tamaricihabitans halophyticus]TCP49374.1 gluconolactonase [Tamaricihabitans halophyticus]